MNEKTCTFEAVFLDNWNCKWTQILYCSVGHIQKYKKNNQIFYFTCFQTMTVTLGKLNVHKCVFILLTVRWNVYLMSTSVLTIR